MHPFLRSALCALLATVALTVSATDFTRIYKDVSFGTSPSDAATYWMYTADETETLTMLALQTNTGSYIPRPFSDESLEEAISIDAGYVGGYYQYQLNVVSGETYYFKLLATWTDSAYYVLQSEAGGADNTLQVTSTTPTEGSTLSLTGTGNVTFYCNLAFTCDSLASMRSGSMVCSTLEVNIISSTCSAQTSFKDVLMEWLQAGEVQPGDDIVFTFTGIASAANPDSLLGADGSLTLSYVVPSMPTQLVEEHVPETFLSYWLPDDEDGLLRLVFDDAISYATAYLTYGERESEEDYYYETFTPQIDDNVLTVDFTDCLRNPSSLLASGTLYESVYIKVGSVLDANGNAVYSDDQGSVGSFSYSLPYSDISQNFATEWLPADGKDISSESTCELYISTSGVVLFDAFLFTYQSVDADASAITDGTLSIGSDAFVYADEDGGAVYTFSFPDEVKAGYNVVLTLDGVQYVDGIYSDERTAMLTVTYNPATDEELAELLSESEDADDSEQDTGESEDTDDSETGLTMLTGDENNAATIVYTLTGQAVRTRANTLEGLPQGLYIVGGRKVLISE